MSRLLPGQQQTEHLVGLLLHGCPGSQSKCTEWFPVILREGMRYPKWHRHGQSRPGLGKARECVHWSGTMVDNWALLEICKCKPARAVQRTPLRGQRTVTLLISCFLSKLMDSMVFKKFPSFWGLWTLFPKWIHTQRLYYVVQILNKICQPYTINHLFSFPIYL